MVNASRRDNPDNSTLHPLPSWSFLWGLLRGIKRIVLAAKFGICCCLVNVLEYTASRPCLQSNTRPEVEELPEYGGRTLDTRPALPFETDNGETVIA